MSSNINGSLSQFNGFGNSSFKTTPVFNSKKETALTTKTNDKTADTVKIDLKNKTQGVNTGEYLLRESLNKISSKYGFNSSDVELEIVTRQQNKTGFSKNHDNYTDEQLAKDIKTRNTKIDFSINQSTIDKMKERKAVLEIIAQKEAFGGNLSEKDISELSELGYNAQDISNLRNVKMMEYGGHKANFEKQVEDNAKQKVYADTKADLKGTLFEENAKLNANGNEEAFNLLMDNETKRRVDDKLRYGQKPALQYLAEQDFEKQRIAEQGKLNERLKNYSVTDYLETSGKNLVNSFYGGIGDAIKGLAVANQGNTIYPNGEQPKVSDTLGYKIGDWIKQDLPKVNQDIDKTFLGGTLPKTIGGLLPAVLGTWVTKNPQATVAVYSGLSTGGAVYDEAKAKGATEKQAQQTALLTGGFIGITSTMGYGKTLEALNSGVGSKAWQQIFKEAVKDGGRNAVIAGGQTIGENAIAKTIYDKNRGYLDNVQERMIAAGITGTALKGGLEIIGKVRSGKNPQTLAETQRLLKVKSQSELNPKGIELRNSGIPLSRKLNQKVIEEANKVGEKQPIAKNWDEVKGLIGKKPSEVKLPKEYFYGERQGKDAIIRKTGNDIKYAPLSLDKEGKIQVGGADNRISNAYKMTGNYEKELQTKYENVLGSKALAETKVKDIKKLVTIHHILPDNVLQKTDLGMRALKAGYGMDEASNLIGLAKNSANKARLVDLGEATPNQPGHWTSHGQYDGKVIEKFRLEQEKLENKYETLDKVPDKVILETMKKIENEFRRQIQNGEVDTKDGRISMMPIMQRRGEIRV
jgi:A nuclease family of the HNH/ENDO VII superfamily with conserved AHH